MSIMVELDKQGLLGAYKCSGFCNLSETRETITYVFLDEEERYKLHREFKHVGCSYEECPYSHSDECDLFDRAII